MVRICGISKGPYWQPTFTFLSRFSPMSREGGGYLFNSSPPLPPASQTLSRAINAESSPLRIASSQTRTGNLWFLSASCNKLLLA